MALSLSSFAPKLAASNDDQYIYRQNGGCGVRIYPNGIGVEAPSKIDLFYEIRMADCERSTTDVAGGFSLFLLPTAPWDELIRPDDFLRIFLGDQLRYPSDETNAFNFASGQLDSQHFGAKLPTIDAFGLSGIQVPIPGSVKANGQASKEASAGMLQMFERMLGKVDRVQKVKNGPGPNQGTTAGYTVSGRSFGALVQDISLYYNEFLAPLNAINIFLSSGVALSAGSPDELVKEVLAIILTNVPFQQWMLPPALVADMNGQRPGEAPISVKNQIYVQEKMAGFQQRLAQFQLLSKNANYKGDIVGKLQALTSGAGAIPALSPLSIISLEGIFECFGETFNRSLLSSTTTGLYDIIKHLSNPQFNEFWFDMCPNGEPDGGRATSKPLYPTYVLRQRPYNITPELLTGASQFIMDEVDSLGGLGTFPPEELDNISADLIDLLPSSFSVTGPLANTSVSLSGSFESFSDPDIDAGYLPTVMPGGYDCGYSGHDRFNAFLVLGNYNSAQNEGTSRVIAASAGGFNLSIDSIRKYGIRVMEISTQYAQPSQGKVQDSDLGQTMGTFSRTIGNWYFMNPALLNGRLTCRFLSQARIGVPVKYFETRITPDNPYPKVELFYVQGVADHFEVGAPITTTLTVIRGVRYNLGGGEQIGGASQTLFEQLQSALNGLTS